MSMIKLLDDIKKVQHTVEEKTEISVQIGIQ